MWTLREMISSFLMMVPLIFYARVGPVQRLDDAVESVAGPGRAAVSPLRQLRSRL